MPNKLENNPWYLFDAFPEEYQHAPTTSPDTYQGATKRDPVIVDIHLKGNTAKRQASTRMGHYMKQGYQIKQL